MNSRSGGSGEGSVRMRAEHRSEFPSEDEALYLTSEIIELRLKHGYQVKSVPL